MQTQAELAQARDQAIPDDPSEYLALLHSRGRLAPLLRKMLDDGEITLDDIDPPP